MPKVSHSLKVLLKKSHLTWGNLTSNDGKRAAGKECVSYCTFSCSSIILTCFLSEFSLGSALLKTFEPSRGHSQKCSLTDVIDYGSNTSIHITWHQESSVNMEKNELFLMQQWLEQSYWLIAYNLNNNSLQTHSVFLLFRLFKEEKRERESW